MNWGDVRGCENDMHFYERLVKTLPRNAKVVEVGVFLGRGLTYLAQHSEFEIYGVDNFVVSAMPYLPDDVKTDSDFYAACLGNIFACEAERKVTLIALPSERAAKLFEDHYFDCVFIDAQHTYEAVKNDISIWRNKVRLDGGFIAGDDYVNPWGGVIQAVDEAFPQRLVMGQTWYMML